MTYSQIVDIINQNIKQNGKEEITGNILNSVLKLMLDFVQDGYITLNDVLQIIADNESIGIIGSINPSTNTSSLPNGFYFAETSGTYTNANNIVVAEGYYTILEKNDSGWKVASSVEMPMQDMQPVNDAIQKMNTFIDDLTGSDNYTTFGFTTENYPRLNEPLSSYVYNGNVSNDYWASYEFHKSDKDGDIKKITVKAKKAGKLSFSVGNLTDNGFDEISSVIVNVVIGFNHIAVNLPVEINQYLAICRIIDAEIEFEPSFQQPIFRRAKLTNIGDTVGALAYSFDVYERGILDDLKYEIDDVKKNILIKNKSIYRCNEEAVIYDANNGTVIEEKHFSHITHLDKVGKNSRFTNAFAIIELNTNSNSITVKTATLLPSTRNENGMTVFVNGEFLQRITSTKIDTEENFSIDLSPFGNGTVKNIKIVTSTSSRDEGNCVPTWIGLDAGSWGVKSSFQLKKKTIVTLSDSIGVGIGSTIAEQHGYLIKLREFYKDWSFIPFGWGGAGYANFQQNQGLIHIAASSSTDVCKWLNKAFQGATEKVIYIAIGTNDGITTAELDLKVRNLFATIQSNVPDATIYVQTPVYASGLDLTANSNVIKSVANLFGFMVFDGLDIFNGKENLLDPIGHPNDEGNEVYFQYIKSIGILN